VTPLRSAYTRWLIAYLAVQHNRKPIYARPPHAGGGGGAVPLFYLITPRNGSGTTRSIPTRARPSRSRPHAVERPVRIFVDLFVFFFVSIVAHSKDIDVCISMVEGVLARWRSHGLPGSPSSPSNPSYTRADRVCVGDKRSDVYLFREDCSKSPFGTAAATAAAAATSAHPQPRILSFR